MSIMTIMTIKRERDLDEYGSASRDLEEEALLSTLQHRVHEVEYLKERIAHYTSLLAEAEAKVKDAQSRLSRLRGHSNADSRSSETPIAIENKRSKVIPISDDEEDDVAEKCRVITDHVAHSRKTKVPNTDSTSKSTIAKEIPSVKACNPEVREIVEDKHESKPVTDAKAKTYTDLISKIGSSTSPSTFTAESFYIPGLHTRKLKLVLFSPSNDDVFATSAIDGEVKLWQVEPRGWSNAAIISSTQSKTPANKWPEDIAWHTLGNSIFCAYTGEPGDNQVSVINLNRKKQKNSVVFLPEKPHGRGLINSIAYMPWDDNCFATGGSDHAVVIWRQSDGLSYTPTKLHLKEHSSAVMGVTGLHQKKVALSAGVDKRVIGFNVEAGKVEWRAHLDSKCFAVVPNPCDCNLLLVQTGEKGKQLRLYDYRASTSEAAAMGFEQESSQSMTALVGQSWSPDGLYLSSGSVDPVVHLFDIRYGSRLPSQSIQAHNRRVFKAAWHQSRQLLVSISSDANIGLHTLK